MNLNPGDHCRVRLHDGRVVEVVYSSRAYSGNTHYVKYSGSTLITVGSSYLLNADKLGRRCRFVGNPCVLEPI